MDKKESFYWDLVKGLAIFLMLWGHCIQYCAQEAAGYLTDIVFKTIYTFHMPLFMLVSGYLFSYSFRKRSMEELLPHRIQGMLQPIVMATILNNVLMLVPTFVLSDRVDVLFGSLFMGISNDLWFLWAVLYCSLVVGVSCKLTDRPWIQLGLLLAGIGFILLTPQWNMTLFMYPYFVAGFFCGLYRKQAMQLYKLLRYPAWILFPIMVAYYEPKHYIYITPMFSEELGLSASLEIALFRGVIGFAGSIWLLSVAELLTGVGNRVPVAKAFLRKLSCLGRNSLQIYCLSLSLLSGYLPHLYRKATELAGGNPFAQNGVLFDFLFTPILAAVWAVMLYYAVLLLKKWKLHKLIFGR